MRIGSASLEGKSLQAFQTQRSLKKMKRLILAGIVALAAFGAVEMTTPLAEANPAQCLTVRCGLCPEGQELSPVGSNCCRCI
jgi:hypothetical protein